MAEEKRAKEALKEELKRKGEMQEEMKKLQVQVRLSSFDNMHFINFDIYANGKL